MLLTKGNVLLRTTLITCTHAAVKDKKSYFYEDQPPRVGETRICCSCPFYAHSDIPHSVVFKNFGVGHYNHFNKEGKINAYLKKLKVLVRETH